MYLVKKQPWNVAPATANLGYKTEFPKYAQTDFAQRKPQLKFHLWIKFTGKKEQKTVCKLLDVLKGNAKYKIRIEITIATEYKIDSVQTNKTGSFKQS